MLHQVQLDQTASSTATTVTFASRAVTIFEKKTHQVEKLLGIYSLFLMFRITKIVKQNHTATLTYSHIQH